MFRLLSKESNIFSIPVYIFFLFLLIISFNILDFKTLGVFSSIITFCGFALGYFLFNAIGLNYNTHLPLFLYTFISGKFRHRNCDVTIYQFFCNGFIDQQSRWSKEKFIPDHWRNFGGEFLVFAYNMAYVYFRVDSPYFYFRSYFAEYFQIIFWECIGFWNLFWRDVSYWLSLFWRKLYSLYRRFFHARLLSIILSFTRCFICVVCCNGPFCQF